MAKDEDKKKEKASKEQEDAGMTPEQTMEKMILDAKGNKYDLIVLARRWAYELKARENETRAIQEIIPDAMHDILTAKVSAKTVRDLPELKLFTKKAKAPTTAILDNIGKLPNDEPEGKKSKKKD